MKSLWGFKEGDIVTVYKPKLDEKGVNDGVYWHPKMDMYDRKSGRIEYITLGTIIIEGFGGWAFHPSWLIHYEADEDMSFDTDMSILI